MNTPLHIAFDVAQTCPPRAGCGWFADALARALVEEAPADWSFSLYHHFGAFANLDTAHGLRLADPRVAHPLDGWDITAARAFWREVERGERALPGAPAVAHACSFHAPRIPGVPLVFTVHDLGFWTVPRFHTETNRLLCQRETLLALENAAAFAFVSDAARAEFESLFPGWLAENRRPVALLRPASRLRRPPHVAPGGDPDGPWLIVGTVEARKNHAALLDALDLLEARGARRRPLVVAGGAGAGSAAVVERLRALEAAGRARWLGYVADDDLPALYAGAHALVFPSWHEGCGMPVLEAMEFGLPVVCSRAASLPEVGGDAPLYVDPADPASLAGALQRMDEPGERQRRVQASLARATRFSWRQTARDALALYAALAATSTSPGRT